MASKGADEAPRGTGPAKEKDRSVSLSASTKTDWARTRKGINSGIEAASAVFDYKKVDETIEKVFPQADLKAAFILNAFAALIISVILLATTMFAAYLLKTVYSDFQVEGGAQMQSLESDWMTLAISGLTMVALNMISSIVLEGVCFLIFKATKGKGTFASQYYMSSIVALSSSVVSILGISMVLPCLSIPMMIAMGIVMLYFGLYVRPKAYAKVHGITLWHALAVVVGIMIVSILIGLALGKGLS